NTTSAANGPGGTSASSRRVGAMNGVGIGAIERRPLDRGRSRGFGIADSSIDNGCSITTGPRQLAIILRGGKPTPIPIDVPPPLASHQAQDEGLASHKPRAAALGTLKRLFPPP